MKIVIVGAGAVGFHLVRELGAEGHSMSLLDINPEKLERVRDRLDVLTVLGSGTSRDALEAAGTPDADLFIAVSNDDEVNVLACTAAHGMGVRRTLARVRNTDFTREDRPLIDPVRLGVTRFINPDVTAVDSIVALIDAPGSIDVGDFAAGHILLRSFDVEEEGRLVGRPLARLREDFAGVRFAVCAIRRDGRQFVPDGEDLLALGDRAYVIMSAESLPVFRKLVSGGTHVQRVVIHGAERLGIEVARRLQERVSVVVIDEDEERCEIAARELDVALVLAGSPNDSDIMGQAKLASADFFIAAGRNEEHNLILALLAKKKGVRRNIVVTADPDLTSLLDRLDIDAVINPRLTTVGRLLRYARGGRVQTVQKLNESQAEVVEMVIRHGARGIGLPVGKLDLPEGVFLAAVLRDNEVFMPHSRTKLVEGDTVVSFVLPGLRDRLENLFARRGGFTFGSAGEAAAGEADDGRPSETDTLIEPPPSPTSSELPPPPQSEGDGAGAVARPDPAGRQGA